MRIIKCEYGYEVSYRYMPSEFEGQYNIIEAWVRENSIEWQTVEVLVGHFIQFKKKSDAIAFKMRFG